MSILTRVHFSYNGANRYGFSSGYGQMSVLSLRKLITSPIGERRDLESLAKIHNAAYPVLFCYIAFWVGDKKAAEQLTEELFIHLLEEPDSRYNDPNFPQQLLLSLATKAVKTYQHESPHPAKPKNMQPGRQEQYAQRKSGMNRCRPYFERIL